MPIQAIIGQRFKQARLNRGLSQEKLALLIGVDRTYYASVELGRRNISIHNIEKITHGLGITLEELFHNL